MTDHEHPAMTDGEFFARLERRKQMQATVNERLSQLHGHGIAIDDDAAPAFWRELHSRHEREQAR